MPVSGFILNVSGTFSVGGVELWNAKMESDTIRTTVPSARTTDGDTEIQLNIPHDELLNVLVLPTRFFRVHVSPESDLEGDYTAVEIDNPNPVDQDVIVQVISENGVDDPIIRHGV